MRLDVLPHSTGRHPECPGDLLQCEQLQRSGHGTNSMNTASSGTPTEIAVGSAEPMDGFRAMSGTLLMRGHRGNRPEGRTRVAGHAGLFLAGSVVYRRSFLGCIVCVHSFR